MFCPERPLEYAGRVDAMRNLASPARSNRSPARRRRALAVATAVWAFGAASCTGNDTESTPPPVPATTAIPGNAAINPVETPCLAASPAFTSRGTVSVLGGSRPDAEQLSGIDWITTPDCERIVFSFLTGRGAPASQIGLSRLEFAPEQGTVRVSMPRDVGMTGVADVKIEGRLISAAFVVRSRSGDLAVDLHTADGQAVQARGILIGSPARLVIDLQPVPADASFSQSRPSFGSDVVVLSPAPGPAQYPLRIRGYARTTADVVTATVEGAGVDVDRRITAAPSADAWGEFSLTISEGPIGGIVLTVATDREVAPNRSAGVSIQLTIP